MGQAILVDKLTKQFKTKKKGEGLIGSIKSIFSPDYSKIDAVRSISFSIEKGEMVGFIGPNGAGKSTTIKMMTGILFPDYGKLSILGYDPQKQRKKLAYHIGTVFGQKPQLWYHLPAIDTFNLFSKIYEIPIKEYRERLEWLISIFEIKDFLDQPVRKLSLGQRMRCEIIASLLHKPKILFLDEPTIGLDVIVRKKVREFIRIVNKKENMTVILTSHDMDDVEDLCKRLIIINNGKLVYDDTMKKIKNNFLTKKIIKVILENKVETLEIKGAKHLYKGTYKHAFEIDTNKHPIRSIVAKIMSKYKVEDISVIDPPIEEIIELIYNDTGKIL